MICGGCGSETRRLTLTMTANGGKTLLPEGKREEVCPHCRPELFMNPWSDPSDRKIWNDHEANPYKYERLSDGSLNLKDTFVSDIAAEFDNNRDEQESIARKRATRRTTPMTPEEIQAADRMMRPAVQEYLADCKKQQEGDAEYTEYLIEDIIRKERDKESVIQ